jgi:hypothetical protein
LTGKEHCAVNNIPIVDARLSPGEVEQAGAVAAQARAEGVPQGVLTGRRQFAELREQVLAELVKPAGCVLRGTGYLGLPGEQIKPYVAELAALFGEVSDSNVVSERSGTFVDEVVPSDPTSKDVTFQFGAIEAHADESSKVRPEDVVVLWCDRPAEWGGDSLLWPAEQLMDNIAAQPDGDALIDVLRTPNFLFGGKLRKPPRLVKAPIFFGENGVRFRMGSLMDAAEVAERPLTEDQQRGIRALVSATETVPPVTLRLEAGDALVWLNRRGLHSRTDFTDRRRLLYRTRCYHDELSISGADQAEWLS